MTRQTTPTLFEMDDFFPNQAPPIKHDPSGKIHFYRCGTHQVGVQADAHIIECLNRTCPACGDPLHGWFDADVNHNVIDRDPSRTEMCMKQYLLTNHVTSSGKHLDGVSDYISTNCYAVSHKQVSGHPTDGYFRRGAPIECTALEFAEKVYWLTTHGVSADSLYQLQTDAARELVATVNRTYAEQIKEARS